MGNLQSHWSTETVHLLFGEDKKCSLSSEVNPKVQTKFNRNMLVNEFGIAPDSLIFCNKRFLL